MSFEHLTNELAVEESVALDETTGTSVAVASSNGALHLAWAGTDHHINTLWSQDGRQFGGKQVLEHKNTLRRAGPPPSKVTIRPAPPSLAAADDGSLLLALIDRSRGEGFPKVVWSGSHAGEMAMPGRAKLDQTFIAPAVGAWGDEAVLVWLSWGWKLMMAHSRGRRLSSSTGLGKAQYSPDVCTVGKELVVAWNDKKWVNPHLNVLWSRGGVFGEPVRCPAATAPVICGLGDELVVSWRHRRARYVGFLRSGMLVPALRLRSVEGPNPLAPLPPALCVHNGCLVVAWVAPDRRIVVTRLRHMTA